MLQILSFSPRFESFATLVDDDNRYPRSEMTCMMAAHFIDADLSSNSLRPWACNSTLRIFRANISKLPRPDITRTFIGCPLKDGMVVEESYLGQSRDIQSRMYERLARMTRLERLELGHEDRDFKDASMDLEDSSVVKSMDDMDHYYDCLEMSLRSGLKVLEGLKELEVLSVIWMTAMIGVEEVQWMLQSWPKLRRVDGLSSSKTLEDAVQRRLKKNCP
ncbi:hypothetical protein BGZ47_004997 [Haplosporangium gracile]|nr:hypothetical protein BGZ47_004997 [Haplosporangium gracile]